MQPSDIYTATLYIYKTTIELKHIHSHLLIISPDAYTSLNFGYYSFDEETGDISYAITHCLRKTIEDLEYKLKL